MDLVSSYYNPFALLAFAIACIWSLALFLFTLVATVKAFRRKYSLAAVSVYWITLGMLFPWTGLSIETFGMMVFALLSPVLTIMMNALERYRKGKLNDEQESSTL